MKVPLSNQDISDLEIKVVNEVLRSERLSIGPRTEAFERAVCDYIGCKFAVGVSSGTAALHLAMIAAGIGSGDEVITSSFSFVASANSVLFVGGKPVFVDIDPRTWQIDPGKIEAAITSRTKAILPVHVFGQPSQMKPIMDIAKRHNLLVIEDSCEAIGATIDGRKAGTMGMSGAFAFYPNKQITTGEGGMLITNDSEVAKLGRSLRNQGRGEGTTWLAHERLGYNYRMSEIQAGLGWAQMQRIEEILQKRDLVANMYIQRLKNHPQLSLQKIEPNVKMSWFVFVLKLADEFSQEQRDRLLKLLTENGIGCNAYFAPIHLQKFYRDQFGHQEGELPITEQIGARTFAVPFFSVMTESQVDYVCQMLDTLIDKI
ncbi:MAG: DegT/DnrJ/EryC1/StrS family aminotransferase [Phycisphaerae bacterium]